MIIPVKQLVKRACEVAFNTRGGAILYPDGRKLKFVIKDGCFFIALNLLPPGTENILGQQLVPLLFSGPRQR